MPYGKNRSKGRANVRAVRSQIKRLEHRLIGRFVKGPVDPPSVVSCPWNSVVISTTLLGDKAGWASIKTGQLRTTLRKQVGLSTEQKIDLRLKRISAWNPWMSDYLDVSGKRWDQFLAMQIYDPFQGTTTATAEDAGTNVRPPHLTYLYPVEIFRKVIGTDQDVVFCQFDVQRNINLILHVEVLWRCPEYDPLPSSDSTLTMTGVQKGNPIRLTKAQATLLSPIVACQRPKTPERYVPPPPPPQDTPPPFDLPKPDHVLVPLDCWRRVISASARNFVSKGFQYDEDDLVRGIDISTGFGKVHLTGDDILSLSSGSSGS